MTAMAEASCVGEGAGWGTLEGVSIRVLLVAVPSRTEAAAAIARALSKKHDVRTSVQTGWGGWLSAARAAAMTRPHLLHAVGFSARARTVALGTGSAFVLGLYDEDIVRAPGKAARQARRADTVIVDCGAAADRLRAEGIDREIYVLPPLDDETQLLVALEVVYGRLLSRRGAKLEKSSLVRIGSPKKAR
jgi:hypothetical protein